MYTARNFSGKDGGSCVELEHFDKHIVKNTRKRSPAGNYFGVFFLDTLTHLHPSCMPVSVAEYA